MTLSIYIASSWRNERYPEVLRRLREAGHEVYDWRAPSGSFCWSEVDGDWKTWSPAQFREGLDHPRAVEGFERDAAAMWRSQVCVLLLPCGRSAHLEAGWFWGQGRPVLVLLAEGSEPELMYRGAFEMGEVYVSLDDLLAGLVEAERWADPRCHKCGCTDDMACEGGCWWVHRDPWLCSACDKDDKTDESTQGGEA